MSNDPRGIVASITTFEHGGYIRTSDNGLRNTGVYLAGNFRHNPGFKFAVIRPLGKPAFNDGEVAKLSAVPTVIAAVKLGDPYRVVNVKDGDLVEVDGDIYRIADDRFLSDPRLVPVSSE